MPISDALKRVYASAPADRRYVETLELSHPLFPKVYYLTNDLRPWDFLLTEGAAVYTRFDIVRFRIVLPTIDAKGRQDMRLTIDNVGREAMDAIEAAAAQPSTNIAAVYRVYLDQALTAPQNNPPLILSLSQLTVTLEAIQGTATRADVLNRPFPSQVYRVDLYPGLNR
jgi:hypothetical protein